LERAIDSSRFIVDGQLLFGRYSLRLFWRHWVKRNGARTRLRPRRALIALRHDVRCDGALLDADANDRRRELPDALARRSIGGSNEKRCERWRLAFPLARLVRRRTQKQFANQLVATP